jgi:hypothetical protein
MRVGLFLLLLAAAPVCAAPKRGSLEAGRREMLNSCRKCHPLQTIRMRRFPREDWDRVLYKMTELGAKIRNREALLDYLAATQGEKAPPGSAKR